MPNFYCLGVINYFKIKVILKVYLVRGPPFDTFTPLEASTSHCHYF